MKQDYLWDKSGIDPEIEGLENALGAFRYQETAPPALPAKILPFPAKIAAETPRRRFSFAFAFAACAAAILITFGVLLHLSNSKTATFIDTAKTTAPPIGGETQRNAQTDAPQSVNSPLVKTEIPQVVEAAKRTAKQSAKQAAKQTVVKTRRSVAGEAVPDKTLAQNTKIRKPNEAALTAEEKQAYDQLMLALSITGSKLKIVRDKVDGVEEQNVVFKDGR